MNVIVNGVIFYAGWIAVLQGVAYGWALTGALVTLLLLALHVAFIATNKLSEFILMLAVAAVGFCIDSLYVHFGLIRYNSPGPFVSLAPIWITLMYALFATSINNSLTWLRHRPLLYIPLGAIGGPMSYQAGNLMGAIEFLKDHTLTLCIIAGTWTLFYPLVEGMAVVIDRRFGSIKTN